MEGKHQSPPVPWLGLGDPGGLQGCCQLPVVPILQHRWSLAEGWGTELSPSRFTGYQARALGKHWGVFGAGMAPEAQSHL